MRARPFDLKALPPFVLLVALGSGCEPSPGGVGADADVGDDSANVASFAPAVRVKTAAVTARLVQQDGGVTGVVHPFREATVAAEVAGRVTARRVEPGQVVQSGQLLFELDTARARLALSGAQADVEAREVDRRRAEHDLRQGEALIRDGVISQDVLDDLRFAAEGARARLAAARAALATAERAVSDGQIGAPFAGSAEIVYAQVGDYLSPGMPVISLADFSRSRVIAGVTAAEAANIRPGQDATLRFPSLGGQSAIGAVRSVARVPDPASGTYNVEIWLDADRAPSLRQGIIVDVDLATKRSAKVLSVPNEALFRRGGQLYVYVVEEGPNSPRARLTAVSVGERGERYSEVTSGLTAGQAIVIDGQFALSDGVDIEVTL